MSGLEVVQIPVLNDNYVYLLRDAASEATAVVDPAVVDPVLDGLAKRGWRLTHILNTHHHRDHTGGNLVLKDKTGCTIVGPRADRARIPGIDIPLGDGDQFTLGGNIAHIFDVPGHTRGHIAYWFPQSDSLFCGDTLFAMGCGRLFEGTPAQMLQSLGKLTSLPGATKVYCAHEYTAANGRFALTVDPDNGALVTRMAEVTAARQANRPTVPSLLSDEMQTNPFLRADSRGIRLALNMPTAPDVDVFAEVRRRKDAFKG